jgi:hypothetical protein
METKKCPFCAEEILREARKCKHCGEFLNAASEISQQAPIVIEATGKGWKLVKAFGVLLMLLSIPGCTENLDRFIYLATAGLVLTIGASVGAWWHHG